MLRAKSALFALLALVAAASPVHAESRVDLTPSLAYFNPTADVIDQDGVSARFAGAPGFGGRISIWLNESVILEGSAHYGRSSLDATLFGAPDAGSIDLALFYGSAQLAVALGSEKRFTLHGGFGVQGKNYDEFIEGGNNWTAVLGLSGWMPLGESTALRADLDVHFHSIYFEVGDLQTDELSQMDMVLAVGIQFTPGG